MQLFTILILVTLPIVFVQFYSQNTPIFSSDEQNVEALFEQMTFIELESSDLQLINSNNKNSGLAILGTDPSVMFDVLTNDTPSMHLLTDDFQQDMSSGEVDTEALVAETPMEHPAEHKKVKLVKGKRHTQGMDFLSVLLMLKDRQR